MLNLSRVGARVEVELDSGLTVSVLRNKLGLTVAVVTPRRVVRSWESLSDDAAATLLNTLTNVLSAV